MMIIKLMALLSLDVCLIFVLYKLMVTTAFSLLQAVESLRLLVDSSSKHFKALTMLLSFDIGCFMFGLLNIFLLSKIFASFHFKIEEAVVGSILVLFLALSVSG